MAAGPSGKQSGNMTVRVAPDTRYFAKELKAYLDKLEKSLRVHVKVELDTAQASAEATALKKRLEADDINLNVRLNETNVSRSFSNFTRRAFNLGAPLVLVGKQFEAIGRSIDRATDGLIRMRQAAGAITSQTVTWVAQMIRSAISIDNAKKAWSGLSSAVLATSRSARQLPRIIGIVRDLAISGAKAFRSGAEALRDEEAWTRRFELAMFKAWNAVYRVRDGLKGVGRGLRVLGDADAWSRGVDIAMFHIWSGIGRVEKGLQNLRKIRLTSITDGIRNIARRAVEAGKAVSRNLGRAADGAVKGLGRGISGVVKSLGGIFSKVGQGLNKFGSSLAGLGRTGGIVVGVLALIAPALGLIVGLLAALPGIAVVAGAAIGAIALGMDGIKAAAGVAGPALERLKTAVSATFEKELTPVFQRVADVLLPGITKGMQGVASALSGNAKAFFDVVTSAQGMEQINSILANTTAFLKNLNPFIVEMTKSFLTAAVIGSGLFDEFARGLSNWAREFNGMIQAAAETGLFEQTLRGLGEVLGALGSVFNDLFQSGMEAMAAIGGPFSSFLKSIGTLFRALTPTLIEISNLVSNVLGEAFNALAPVFKELTPAIQALGKVLTTALVGVVKTLAPILTALAKIVGTVLAEAFTAIQPVLVPVVEFLTQLGTVIGEFLMQAFAQLSPILSQIIQFLAGVLMAVTPLLPALLQLATVVLTSLIQIITPLTPLLQQLATTVFPKVLDIVKLLVPVITDLVTALAAILPKMVEIVVVILEQLIPVFEAVLAVVQSVWPQIEGIIAGAVNIIKGIINLAMGIITGDWSRAWEGIKSILVGAWNLIWNAVKGAINLIVSVVREIPLTVLSALGNLGGLLWNAGVSLVQGFINGIKSMFNAARNAASGLVESVRNFFPFSPAKEGPFSGRGYTTWSGKALVEDFAKSIEDTAPIAAKAMDSMMSATQANASAEWQGHISSDDFGSIGDKVAAALSGWSVQMDANGLTRLVNNTNIRKARRG